jgi:hypothetical protein
MAARKKKTTAKAKAQEDSAGRASRTASRARAKPKKKAAKKKATRRRRPPAWCDPFLVELARRRDVSKAAAAVEIGRRTAYDRREADPAFAEAWDEIMGPRLRDDIRASLFQMMTVGIREHEVQEWTERAEDGQEVERTRTRTKHRQSEQVAMFLARGHLPEFAHLSHGGPEGPEGPNAAEVLAAKVRGFLSVALQTVPSAPPPAEEPAGAGSKA